MKSEDRKIKEIINLAKEQGRTLTCKDFDTVYSSQFCCESCHEDAEEGYFDLMETEVMGVSARLCCALYRNLADDGYINNESD